VSYRKRPQPHCPACDVALDAVLVEQQAAHQCPRCQGFWVPLATFDRFVEVAFGRHIELIEFDDAERRPCPVCAVPMPIVLLHQVRLDRCGADGVWCDPGELKRVVRADTGEAELAGLRPPEKKKDDGEPPPFMPPVT